MIRILLSGLWMLCCSHVAFAQGPLILDGKQQRYDVSPSMSVFVQTNFSFDFNELRQSQNAIPYQTFNQANYGFNNKGAWLYTKLTNNSELSHWFLRVNFSQLDAVDLYLVNEKKQVKTWSAGLNRPENNLPLPTFELDLPVGESVELYLFVNSKKLALLAPVIIETASQHLKSDALTYLIWGALYGGLVVLMAYSIYNLFRHKDINSFILVAFIGSVFIWLLGWTGHARALPVEIGSLGIFQRLDYLIPIIGIIITSFTISFFRHETWFNQSLRYLELIVVVQALTLLMVWWGIVSPMMQTFWIWGSGVFTVIANLYASILCFRGAYRPAAMSAVGFFILLLGCVFSILMQLGNAPINIFTVNCFQLSLISLCFFLTFAVAFKERFQLQLEVLQATADAENNFLLIEEQNVHLDIARRDAEKASDVKSQFLANMSHEIRTPLNAIIGFSKEILTQDNVVERDEHVRIINSAAGDLLTIVNDILDFSKMEAGKHTLNEKPFSLLDMFEDVAGLTAKSAHLKQLEFIFDVDKMPSKVSGDEFKLKQLLNNLLSNALKFTNYGSVALRATFSHFHQNSIMLRIEVQDSGIGMSEKDQRTLFTPFHQLDDDLNRSFQGTGLGLVICQELAFLMRGQINVESAPSVGSKFSIDIPLTLVNDSLKPREQASWLGSRVAIVDRNYQTRRGTCKQLRHVGASTTSFEQIDHLLACEQRFDLALVSLPIKWTRYRAETIKKAFKIDAKKLIFLYSGATPQAELFAFSGMQPIMLRLPLTSQNLSDLFNKERVTQAPKHTDRFSHLPRARILAVDDMPLNLKLLQTWFKHTQIQLDTASSGQQAITLCQQHEYDMILMDIQMPSMDGLEATKHIRQTTLNLGTPIIAITAHAFQEEKQHFLSSGMDDYLPKPINLEVLIDMIRNWCMGAEQNDTADTQALSIDWQVALRKANGSEQGAYDYLQAFTQELPSHIAEIELHWQAQDIHALAACVHKLHGGASYTGVAKLQHYCDAVEAALKRNQVQDLAKDVSFLLIEAKAAIQDWQTLKEGLHFAGNP